MEEVELMIVESTYLMDNSGLVLMPLFDIPPCAD